MKKIFNNLFEVSNSDKYSIFFKSLSSTLSPTQKETITNEVKKNWNGKKGKLVWKEKHKDAITQSFDKEFSGKISFDGEKLTLTNSEGYTKVIYFKYVEKGSGSYKKFSFYDKYEGKQYTFYLE